MDYVVDKGYQVVSTTQIADWIIDSTILPTKAMALHFDNGWLDTADVVQQILRDYGIAATCFPITSGVEAAAQGQTATVCTLTEGNMEKPFMTWAHLQSLLDNGWEIGAHTDSRCKVAAEHEAGGDEAVLCEVNTSNELFQKHLGTTPVHFAYPSGSRTDLLLSQHYRSLRLWHFEHPIQWSFTNCDTSPLAIDCQNIDVRVSFDDFKRIFDL